MEREIGRKQKPKTKKTNLQIPVQLVFTHQSSCPPSALASPGLDSLQGRGGIEPGFLLSIEIWSNTSPEGAEKIFLCKSNI